MRERDPSGWVRTALPTRITCALVSGALVARVALAREYEQPLFVESVEDLYQFVQNDEIDRETADTLLAFLEDPLDLNRADAALLYELPGVTQRLAGAIEAFRVARGPFGDLDDLRQVPGVTDELLDGLAPFVVVRSSAAAKDEAGGTPAPPTGAPAPTAAQTPAEARTPILAEAPIPAPIAGGRGEPLQARLRFGSSWRESLDRSATPPDRYAASSLGPQAYLSGHGQGYGIEAGLLASWRRTTVATWDVGRGQLVTPGPADRLELDAAYVHARRGRLRFVLGSYDAGFGERLTFDTSVHREPDGWYERHRIYEDRERGTLRPDTGLFGAAATLADLDLASGQLDLTVFGSWQKLDAYQHRGIWYRFDDRGGHGEGDRQCARDSECPAGYDCDPDLGVCRSTRVYDADDPAVDPETGGPPPSYRYVTFEDAFAERLAGGHLSFRLADGTRVGITGYLGDTEIRLAAPARPRFAAGAAYPNTPWFGAVGIDARGTLGAALLAGEYAYTGKGGHAAYARLVYTHPRVAELTLAVRYYDARYENPRGRAEAAPDLEGGLAARNEAGVRLQAVVMPRARLRLVTEIDAWRPLQRATYEGSRQCWELRARAALDMHVQEYVSYGITRRETVYAVVRYDNKDIAQNGREESYDETSDGESDTDTGAKGEKRSVKIGAWTTRLAGMRLGASASLVATDVARLAASFDYRQLYRLQARMQPWVGGTAALALAYGHHRRQLGGGVASDREVPEIDGSLELAQRFDRGLTVRMRYGVLHYRGERPDNPSWYQLATISVEGRL